MAASPNKALLTVAHRALALLDPDWQIAADLRAALESAQTVKAAPKRKSSKIPFACNDGAVAGSVWAEGGICWRITRELAVKNRKRKQNIAGDAIYANRNERIRAIMQESHVDLSICACGHGSGAHKADELENLLACEASGCHCDHFHYGADSAPTKSKSNQEEGL